MASALQKYAVIDIETTGGNSKRDKITEIAIIIIDNTGIIETYTSLINPGRSIPVEISRITGITDDMVRTAPKFFEIAKKVVSLTDDTIFVAHNVRFDYSFIREEFKSLGYTYSKKLLCTVQLSRKFFPGLKSYSLGNLIAHFNLKVTNRHRAYDDAMATSIIFQSILTMDKSNAIIGKLTKPLLQTVKIPIGVESDMIDQLPSAPGVYYFLNTHDIPVYIGKSINIKDRVKQHFQSVDNKSDKFIRSVVKISCKITGHDLTAMLLESEQIKTLRPEINKAQRQANYAYSLLTYRDQRGFWSFDWKKCSGYNQNDEKILLGRFTSIKSIKSKIQYVVERFDLCACLCNVHSCGQSCFFYDSGQCQGAYLNIESISEYNSRAKMAIDFLNKTFTEDMIIVVTGPSENEKGVLLIQNGHYRGMNYLPLQEFKEEFHYLKSKIKERFTTPESDEIIKYYLEKNNDYKLIKP